MTIFIQFLLLSVASANELIPVILRESGRSPSADQDWLHADQQADACMQQLRHCHETLRKEGVVQLGSDPCDVSASYGFVGEFLRGISYQWIPAVVAGVVGILMVAGPVALINFMFAVLGSLLAGIMVGSCIDFFFPKGASGMSCSWIDAVNSFLDARSHPACYWVATVWASLSLVRCLTSWCCQKQPKAMPSALARRECDDALLQQPLLNATADMVNRNGKADMVERRAQTEQPKVTRPQAGTAKTGADAADGVACGCAPSGGRAASAPWGSHREQPPPMPLPAFAPSAGRPGEADGRQFKLPRPPPSPSTGILAQMKRRASAIKDELTSGLRDHYDARPGGLRANSNGNR